MFIIEAVSFKIKFEHLLGTLLSGILLINIHVFPIVTDNAANGLEAFLNNTKAAIRSNLGTSLNASQGVESVNAGKVWYSIFPVDNEDLVYGNWEDKIIWDTEVRTTQTETDVTE